MLCYAITYYVSIYSIILARAAKEIRELQDALRPPDPSAATRSPPTLVLVVGLFVQLVVLLLSLLLLLVVVVVVIVVLVLVLALIVLLLVVLLVVLLVLSLSL